MKLINTYTGTYPVVFHAPGSSRKHPFWEEMVSRMEHLEPVEMSADVEIITWSSYDHPTLLEKCCDILNLPLTVLRPKGEWTNVEKINLLVEYLPKCKAKYVIGLDADDVILTASPDEIVKRWQDTYGGSKLLYNGAKVRWPRKYSPPTRACDKFETEMFTGRAKHINAGAWVGEREYVLSFYKQVQAVDRQTLFHKKYRNNEQPSVRCCAYPANYPDIMVDVDSCIFQHMLSGVTDCAYTEDYDLQPGTRLVYYDCGAFNGKTTLNFIKSHNPSVAYAIEPFTANMQSEYWHKLYDTCTVPVNASCWTSYGDMTFYRGDGDKQSQSGTIIDSKANVDDAVGITVPTICFADYLLERNTDNDYTVVKMDIEGAEYEVLQQMMDRGVLSLVNELRIEFHGNKIDGDYTALESEIAQYCADNNVNLIIMDH